MIKYFPFIALQLLSYSIAAQSLGEDASLSYYWKNQLQQARLYNDNGLGKELWIKNIPDSWFGALQNDLFSTLPDAGFGHLTLSAWGAPRFSIKTNFSQWGEADGTLAGRLAFKNLSTGLRLNGQYFNKAIDKNKDSFSDLPFKQRFLLANNWDINVPNYSSSNRIYYLGLQEKGGQINNLAGDTSAYGTQLNMKHLLVQSQHLIALRKADLLLFDIKVKDHDQTRAWGDKNYRGKEWLAEASARYEYHLGSGLDIFRIGAMYRQQRFDESLDSLKLKRSEHLAGGFFGYDSYWGKHLLVITQMQMYYHNLAGLRLSPSVKVNYSPIKNGAANFYAGNAWRYANPLTENARFLYSGRQVQIPSTPLLPENLWYYGMAATYGNWVNIDNAPFCNFYLRGTSSFTHKIYTQQVVTDLDADAYSLRFYNLQAGDKAFAFSWDLDLQLSFSRPALTFNLDYRYDRMKTTIDGQFRDLPFYSKNNWQFSLQYVCSMRIRGKNVHLFNLMNYWYVLGAQRIPDVSAKTVGFPTTSNSFGRWDIQIVLPVYDWITKPSKWKNFWITLGFDNLTNSTQAIRILHRDHPFSNSFDASMGWNTWVGRRFYGSLQYTF